MKIQIISFTQSGAELSKEVFSTLIAKGYEVEVFGKYPSEIVDKLNCSVYDFARKAFEDEVHGVIFIGALGIAVRAIAPNIVSKGKDPAVLVMDDVKRFVIPVLSGHIGGANELAEEIAEAIRVEPIITTSTDGHGKFAVDTWAVKNGCSIVDISKIKYISSAILRGESVGLICDFPIEGKLPQGVELGDNYEVGICISGDKNKSPFKQTLNLIPKEYILGVGCRRNTPIDNFQEVLNNVLVEENISVLQIKSVASIDIKAQEEAILEYCKKEDLKFITYSAEELLKVEGEFTSSAFVKSITGVDNVCERSAQKTGESMGGELILRKYSCNGVTVAISQINWRCKF